MQDGVSQIHILKVNFLKSYYRKSGCSVISVVQRTLCAGISGMQVRHSTDCNDCVVVWGQTSKNSCQLERSSLWTPSFCIMLIVMDSMEDSSTIVWDRSLVHNIIESVISWSHRTGNSPWPDCWTKNNLIFIKSMNIYYNIIDPSGKPLSLRAVWCWIPDSRVSEVTPSNCCAKDSSLRRVRKRLLSTWIELWLIVVRIGEPKHMTLSSTTRTRSHSDNFHHKSRCYQFVVFITRCYQSWLTEWYFHFTVS